MVKAMRWMMSAYYSIAILLPSFVFAQGTLPRRIVPCDGIDCEVCHLATLAQNIINTGIFMFVLLAAVMFTYAGFLYLTSSVADKISTATSIFKHVAGGLVLLLSAWLIVDTLMKSLLGGDFGPWNDICRVLN